MSDQEATNPVAEEEHVSTAAEGVADEAAAQGDDQTEATEETGEDADNSEADDSEEIDVDGIKARVPKALKDAFLRQADYTRKTQEVAEARRTVEARQAEIAQQAETVQALRADYGRVHALTEQVAAYEALNWQALNYEDPAQAQTLWMQYQQTKDTHAKASAELTEKERAYTEETQRTSAKRLSDTWATLRSEIKGWDDHARQAADYAQAEFGVTLEDLRSADARTWKLLHRAQSAEAKLKVFEAKQTTAQRVEKQQTVTPAKTVGAKAGQYKPGLDDSLPMDEWNRRFMASRKRA